MRCGSSVLSLLHLLSYLHIFIASHIAALPVYTLEIALLFIDVAGGAPRGSQMRGRVSICFKS